MGSFEEFAEIEIEGAGDAKSDGEGGVGLFAFNLAEHGTADAAGVGERLKGPAALGAKSFDAVAEVAIDGLGLGGVFWGGDFFQHERVEFMATQGKQAVCIVFNILEKRLA